MIRVQPCVPDPVSRLPPESGPRCLFTGRTRYIPTEPLPSPTWLRFGERTVRLSPVTVCSGSPRCLFTGVSLPVLIERSCFSQPHTLPAATRLSSSIGVRRHTHDRRLRNPSRQCATCPAKPAQGTGSDHSQPTPQAAVEFDASTLCTRRHCCCASKAITRWRLCSSHPALKRLCAQ